MPKQVFINLPVKDLEKSVHLYTAIGFTNNPQFSDETAKCMVWSDTIHVMLLSHEKFLSFTSKTIANTINEIAGLYSLTMDSIDAVHNMMQKGLEAGATEPTEMKDYGFMQQRTLEDFDGHTWEIFYMDVSN